MDSISHGSDGSDTDYCPPPSIRAHPGPGAPNGQVVQPWIAVQNIEVEYFGHTSVSTFPSVYLGFECADRLGSAHAAYAPWEGQNALDAAFLAYSGISVLRQQIKPTHRVQGVFSGSEYETNGRHPSSFTVI